jgi:hypothetical protein
MNTPKTETQPIDRLIDALRIKERRLRSQLESIKQHRETLQRLRDQQPQKAA